jgi:hypothetical protein
MNVRNILPLIICISVLVLATAALPLSRSAHQKTARSLNGYSDPPTVTETEPATMAFAHQVQCAFHEDTSSLVPSRSAFEPTRYATAHTPNFSKLIRRAPMRRKGRIQH